MTDPPMIGKHVRIWPWTSQACPPIGSPIGTRKRPQSLCLKLPGIFFRSWGWERSQHSWNFGIFVTKPIVMAHAPYMSLFEGIYIIPNPSRRQLSLAPSPILPSESQFSMTQVWGKIIYQMNYLKDHVMMYTFQATKIKGIYYHILFVCHEWLKSGYPSI